MAVQGVDLSYCQPNVDFNKLKADGFKFVILRGGYGNAVKYPQQYDTTFEKHYKAAKAAGLDVGAYWYSYANSVEDAKQEAQGFIKILNGKKFEYPIYFDIEERSQFYSGVAFCDSIINAFCGELEKAGYYAAVYCSTYWYTNFVSSSVRNKYPCWIAEYNSRCTYTGTYQMWQNGLVYVSGIGNIDHDFCYVDYPSIIKTAGKNGYTKTVSTPAPKPSPVPTKPTKTVDELAKEVIAGKWSVGTERKQLLTKAGYNYDAVQKRVNEIMNPATSKPKKSIDTIAKEVIQGKWSAGAERMKLLTNAGYDYMTVQRKVEQLLAQMK